MASPVSNDVRESRAEIRVIEIIANRISCTVVCEGLVWLTSLIAAEQTQACFSGASERRMHEKVNVVLLQELGGHNLWGVSGGGGGNTGQVGEQSFKGRSRAAGLRSLLGAQVSSGPTGAQTAGRQLQLTCALTSSTCSVPSSDSLASRSSEEHSFPNLARSLGVGSRSNLNMRLTAPSVAAMWTFSSDSACRTKNTFFPIPSMAASSRVSSSDSSSCSASSVTSSAFVPFTSAPSSLVLSVLHTHGGAGGWGTGTRFPG